MNVSEEREVRDAKRSVATRPGPPTRYSEAVNRYLGAAAYPDLIAHTPSQPAVASTPAVRPAISRAVVVGVDSSPASFIAVDHAAIEAELRGWHLRLVHVQRPVGVGSARRDDGATLLAHMAERVHARSRRVAVVSRLHIGSPAVTLLNESMTAGLLVVGSGHGRAGEALGASVSSYVSAHHRGPVMIVRVPGWPPGHEFASRPVVVGVDGSPGSDRALEFAVEEARLRGCDLVMLHAANADDSSDDPLHGTGLDEIDGVTVHHRRVVNSTAQQALIQASLRAAALVVGSRGHGGLGGLLLGSVSRSVSHDARCPVFVVH